MSSRTLLALCLLAVLVVVPSLSTNAFFEVERHAGEREIVDRSEASGKRSVHLKAGEDVVIRFCLEAPDTIRVQNVYFSNDGFPDTYELDVDGQNLGTFTGGVENSRLGRNWNVIQKSGPVGDSMDLEAGTHSLTLRYVEEDKVYDYGAELDMVEIEFQDVENGELRCLQDPSDNQGLQDPSDTQGLQDPSDNQEGLQDPSDNQDEDIP